MNGTDGAGESTDDCSMDNQTHQIDNFNPLPYSNSPSYFHDPSGNGMMPTYTSNTATIMVHQIVQQLQAYVKENQELKKSIRVNNQEMENRFLELEEWKNDQKKEKLKLKQNFDKAHRSTTFLKTENTFLKSENIKLELRINELSMSSSTPKFNDGLNSDDSNVNNESFHNKYLATVENLERQLKDAISSREEALSMQKRIVQVNRTLQQKLQESQLRLREKDENKRVLELNYQKLLKELKVNKEQMHNAEITNKEVKAQLVQVLNDVTVYQNETENLKSEKEQCHCELNECRSQLTHLQERLKKEAHGYKTLQTERNQDVMILEKRLVEKDRTLDDLFNEYEKVRIKNQQLTTQGDNMLARVLSAEESLKKKDRELKEKKEVILREEARLKEEIRMLQENVTFFKAQADVYKQDFLQEREDRSKLHEQNEQLRIKLEQLQINGGNRYDGMRR